MQPKQLGSAILFLLFLYPITSDIYSINYSFWLLPIFLILFRGKVKRPSSFFLFGILIYCLVFVFGLLYQVNYLGDASRRFVSFVIFMSIFSYMFIEVDEKMTQAFKVALVGISFFLSLKTTVEFFVFGGVNLGFEAKELVGSQRYGFIYLLAIWIMCYDLNRIRLNSLIKYFIIVIILFGLFLTFSRASIVSLIASWGIYTAYSSLKWFKKPKLKTVFQGLMVLVGIGVAFYIMNLYVPLIFEFFNERLFSFLFDKGAVASSLGDQDSSEGVRVAVLEGIFRFILNNPLTGAGFLGVWVLTDIPVHSAHNQYMDILFRTGIPGFLFYMAMMVMLFKHLFKNNRSLFWGFISVLMYGLFHETFKESHGTFVLAFLFGMMSSATKKEKTTAEPLPGNTAVA